MCTHFSVFIQDIHLQNTDFEVIHKRNKYYLISIFLKQCEGGGHPYPIPAPPPLVLAISCLQRWISIVWPF